MKEELEIRLKQLEKEQNMDSQRMQMLTNQKQQLEDNLKVRIGKIQILRELLQQFDTTEDVDTVEAEA